MIFAAYCMSAGLGSDCNLRLQQIKINNQQFNTYISKIGLFHLTYCEMPAEYAEAFLRLLLTPNFNFS